MATLGIPVYVTPVSSASARSRIPSPEQRRFNAWRQNIRLAKYAKQLEALQVGMVSVRGEYSRGERDNRCGLRRESVYVRWAAVNGIKHVPAYIQEENQSLKIQNEKCEHALPGHVGCIEHTCCCPT